ncbi:hypothetical protein GCM10011387_22430 [Pedobacter quisquiliarum]|uniref:DUF4440 domain-containing protein n=1 Tax=Pedobacter quisquiliarum TaxID=1834438 RepID=A0A916UCF8_9SPHI|nr:DUF4440 domain-containing protein [Pedobacter quisquiliarum]GGC68528.1 hypothetical protein GCM10011387_22430 [Pedobacter quisquiliarum]
MNAQNQKSLVEQLISAYQKAVNDKDAAAISAFYTSDGSLLAEGFKSIAQAKAGESYFLKADVNINFSIKEVTVEGSYAFVEARAKTKIKDLKSNIELNKNTRDLFILKNTEGDWKIYRYIFNSFQA